MAEIGRQTIYAGACFEVSDLAAQVQSVVEALGNPALANDDTVTNYENVYYDTTTSNFFYVDGDTQVTTSVTNNSGGTCIVGTCVATTEVGAGTFTVENIDVVFGAETSSPVTFNNTHSLAYTIGDSVIGWKRADTGNYETENLASGGTPETCVIGQVNEVGNVAAIIGLNFDVNNVDVVFGSHGSTATFINTFGITYSNNDFVIGWKRADDSKFETASGGSAGTTYTGSDGIDVSGLVIKVDQGDGLAIDTNLLVVKLATLGGLEFDGSTPGQMQSKNRFSILKGRATTGYNPSSGLITITGVSAVRGELPDLSGVSGVLTAFTTEDIWVDNDDEVYVTYDPRAGGGTNETDQWDVSTAYNFDAMLKGREDFDDELDLQCLSHESGTVKWVEAKFINITVSP